MTVDLAAIRQEYERAGLQETNVDPSPVRQLEKWLKDAIDAEHPEPTAMTLATVSEAGVPAARIVLLKRLDDDGLGFFTNYDSEKGRHLEKNPNASASFFWVLLERQVRVTGIVRKMSREASEAYFHSRPRESQLGAWASRQSTPIEGREALERALSDVRRRFGDGEIPCPPYWGGYVLAPTQVEFWQGGAARLHDRLRYTRIEGNPSAWTVTRLSP